MEKPATANDAQRKAASRERMTDEQRENERLAARERMAQPEAREATR